MSKSKASEAKGVKPSGFSLEFLNPASLVSGGVTAPKQEVCGTRVSIIPWAYSCARGHKF
jgi:hypothetical protein